MSCVRVTYAEEGARGFFRGNFYKGIVVYFLIFLNLSIGMIPPLVTVSIIKSVSFSIYENTKKSLIEKGMKNDSLYSTLKLSTASGAVSGAFIALLSCPLELVKIQRQLEQVMLKNQIAAKQVAASERVNSSSWYAVKQIVHRKGVFGLWSGVGCHSGKSCVCICFICILTVVIISS
jgi:hypothetical protein